MAVQVIQFSEIVAPAAKAVPAMVQQFRRGEFHGEVGAVHMNGNTPRWSLVYGSRRLASAIAAGKTEGAFDVVGDADAHEIAKLRLAENANRSANPLAELRAIETLLASGSTVKEIARETGMSVPVIRKRMRLARLIEPLQVALMEGRITPNTAIEASTLPPGKQHDALDMLREGGKLTQGMVRELRFQRRDGALAAIADAIGDVAAGDELRGGGGGEDVGEMLRRSGQASPIASVDSREVTLVAVLREMVALFESKASTEQESDVLVAAKAVIGWEE
jgi:ParB/RepB/Spo0J family partition protein